MVSLFPMSHNRCIVNKRIISNMTLAERVACENLNKMINRRYATPHLSDVVCFGVYDLSSKRLFSVHDNFYVALDVSKSLSFPSTVLKLRAEISKTKN